MRFSAAALSRTGGNTSTRRGGDITIELVTPDNLPAAIRINWPAKPTVTGARKFPDTAAVIVKLFSEAATTLAAIKVGKRL